MPVSLLWFVGSSTGPTVTPCASVLAVHHGHVELLLQLTCTEIAGELATSVIGHRWIFCHSVPGISRDPPDPLRSEAPISKTRFLACGGAMLLRRCFFAKAAGINKKAAAGAAVERFECIATRKSRGQKGTQIHCMLVY